MHGSNATNSIKSILFFLPILLLINSCKSTDVIPIQPTSKSQYAITDVSVIPMTSTEVLPNQTVVIEAGKIIEISNAAAPTTAIIIDGTGKFLLPGLTEMHAHIPVAEEGDDALVKETLFLYLSQGVTNIRGNSSDHFRSGRMKHAV